MSSWGTTTLGELCLLQGGTVFPKDLQGLSKGDIPFIKVADMNLPRNGLRILDSRNWVSADVARLLRARCAPVGSVVFAKIGEALHHGRFRRVERPTIIDNNLMAAVPRPAVNPDFLYYLLVFSDLPALALGSAVPYINAGDIARMEVDVPRYDEQRAIAEVLGALDDKIELNRQMNRTLEEMASALFERMMGAVDDDPALEVAVQSLIDRRLLVVGDGYRAKNNELAPSGLPFARAGNIDAGFLFADAELLGWPAVERAGSKVSVPHDVVFTSKGTVGRFAFVAPTTPRFAYSPQLCFWRSQNHDALSPYFLYQWMRSRRFLEQVDAVKGQTDMADYVSLTDQRLMKVAVPAPPLQQCLREEVAPLWALHFSNTDETKTLTALRDALLPKLLSGEVRLRQAEKMVEAAL